ncbi:MAG TPA: hypothetical protein VNU46_01015 [Gemmatimonadaceae bacterium]|nr:hypothetical protein [Gemmatimonadaceae bacterium]
MPWLKLALTLTMRSLRHPTLALDLLRVTWRFRHRRWYQRFPFLPIPDQRYVRWRMYTVYGTPDAVPPARDVERYARWATSTH